MNTGYLNQKEPGLGIERNPKVQKGLAGLWDIIKREWWQLFKLNWFFLLGCIPILTIPVSIVAMNWVLTTMVEDQPRFLWQDFWRIYQREFFRALLVGWLWFFCCAAVGFSIWFYYQLAQNTFWFWILVVVMVAVFTEIVTMSFDLFPMQACVLLHPGQLIKNAFLLSFIHVGANFLLVALLIFLLTTAMLLFPYSLWFFLLCGCSIWGLVTVYSTNPYRKRYVVKQEEEMTVE